MNPSIVRLAGVTKRYREGERDIEVLSGLDLEVRRGEFVALVGPSGSGKSTLLNVLSGMDLPDSGEVLIAGESMLDLDETSRTLFRGRRIGFVFQFYNLVPTLTVEENVLLPLELRGSPTPAGRERARELLRRVGLEDRGASWPDRLSGGEQQRVAIARALVHEPELVLADEPTGNLDRDTGTKVLNLMTELLRANQTTLLVVTHSLDVAARMDRIFELGGGRLTERDGVADRRVEGTPPR